MPIDVEKAMAAKLPNETLSWNEDQVILYHLGIGAGVPSTDPGELAYTYEANLKVMPTFAVIPVGKALLSVIGVEGLEFNPALLLHGEQEIEVHGPIPTAASAVNSARIAGIYDKGKAALVVLETETKDLAGKSLFTNRFSLFLRGEGGFGGASGPKQRLETPDRTPDAIVESPTLPQQALIYRLSGDKNPLHCDPAFAAFGGFDRPILHGLCTYGIACKAAVDKLLDGDVARVAKYQARFRGVVYPGETIVTSLWREGHQIFLKADTKERGSEVLSNTAITLHS